MKNYILSLLVFLALVLNSNAQLQNSNWYFGNEAGLNFDDGTSSPTTLTDGVMSTLGGSASISDDDGNLLFYTNGINVWGADHEIISNGSGLYGSTTVSQSVLIVPNPTNEKEYYIITNQGQENGSLGLHYTVVKVTNDDDDNNNDDNNNSNDDSKLSKGVVTGVSSSWKTVTLPNNYNSMVVVATPNYTKAGVDPMVVRIRNASGNTFQVRAGSAGGTVTPIDVHYVVVEEGVYQGMEAVKYNSTVTDKKNSWVGESRTYTNSYTNPVVLGQVMTYNDAGFSTFWSYGNSRTNTPNATHLRTGKSVGEDTDTTRNNETIGYIVIEAGSGSMNGISYSAAVGSDKVTHAQTSYSINLSGAEVAVASISGLDGPDGGWAILSSSSPVSGTALKLSIDEDIIGDSETNHTNEQVAYIVFTDEVIDQVNDYEYCNDSQTKVQICHKGKNTLCVSINAVQAHLDHGDTLGSCDDDDDDDDEPVFAVDRKNIQLLPYASEKLTAVYDQTNNSYWVVSFAPSSDPAHNDTFYAFKVDSNGINLTQESTFNFYAMNNEYTGGQMKISSDLTSLGMAHNTIEIDKDGGLGSAENVFTFDFNKDTGIVSSMNIQTALVVQNNSLELITSDNGFHNVHVLLTGRMNSINLVSSVYGFEFSPDGDKFYISTNEKIDYNTSVVSSYLNILQVQYRNFDSSDPLRIQQIGNDALTSVYSLQLGMDRKIYVTDNTGNIDQISNPNGVGLNANYENDLISLDGNIAGKGLPQLIKGMIDEVSSGPVSTKSSSIVQGNPFKNELKIELLNAKSIEFYNQQGTKVKSVVYNGLNYSSRYTVDTSDLNTGIYFLVIKDENSQVWNETVIKI